MFAFWLKIWLIVEVFRDFYHWFMVWQPIAIETDARIDRLSGTGYNPIWG